MSTLNEVLRQTLGAGLLRADAVSGGDINLARRLTLEDGSRVFMKANRRAPRGFFEAEADGLAAISAARCLGAPRVLGLGDDPDLGAFLLLEWVEPAPRARDFWEAFGRGLAAMHRAPTPDRFGWTRDNFIGAAPQSNAPADRWTDFFRDRRLAPQLRRAQGWLDAAARRRADRLLERLDEYLPQPPRPALLHGDLWSGNFVTGGDGRAWLVDPAVYAGHPEADLAMTELFGGFPERFYDAYREAAPLADGYPRRRELYNL